MELNIFRLINREPEKTYNLNKALLYQKPAIRNEEEDSEEILDFDEEAYQKEQEKKRKEKIKRYENSLRVLLEQSLETGEISLLQLQNKFQKAVSHQEETVFESQQETLKQLIPNVEIFKEIMVELIRNKEINIEALKRERSEFIQDQTTDFQLNEMLLQLCEGEFAAQKIT